VAFSRRAAELLEGKSLHRRGLCIATGAENAESFLIVAIQTLFACLFSALSAFSAVKNSP
jgi:hypothetical protein